MDSTRPIPAVDGPADQDQPNRPGDATQPFRPAGDATQAFRPEFDRTGDPPTAMPADATTAMPPVDPYAPEAGAAGVGATGVGAAESARWAGRAEVPVPGAVGPAGPVAGEEETPAADPYGGRSWLMPVGVGMLALMLLAVLGVGIWLIVRSTGKDATPTDAPTAPQVTASAPPTSAAATPSPTPTPSPSAAPSTAPATVLVANVRGMTRTAATATLRSQGLVVSGVVQQQADASVPVGTVIATDPPAGSEVNAGTSVGLIVASAPRTTPPATSAAQVPSASASGG
jgi:hypothetical protein